VKIAERFDLAGLDPVQRMVSEAMTMGVMTIGAMMPGS
jgi:hypothetical protein